MFSKRIFRDSENILYQETPFLILFRVMRYGSIDDIKYIKTQYSFTTVKKFLKAYDKQLDQGEKRLLALLYQ